MSNSWSSLNIWSNYVHTTAVFGDVFIVRQASHHLSNFILSQNLNLSLQSCSIEQVNWLINSFPESITGIPSILPILVERYIMMYIYVNLVLLSKIVSNIGVHWDDLEALISAYVHFQVLYVVPLSFPAFFLEGFGAACTDVTMVVECGICHCCISVCCGSNTNHQVCSWGPQGF